MAKAAINLSSQKIGEIEIHERHGVSISKELGFYRLRITAKITINRTHRDGKINNYPMTTLAEQVILSNVLLKLTLNNKKSVGYAFPENPVGLQSIKTTDTFIDVNFFLDIDQKTIDAIEKIRAGKDLLLICDLKGIVFLYDTPDKNGLSSHPVSLDGMQVGVSRSDWSKALDECGYCETMLVEINILNRQNSIFSDRIKMLKEANERMLSGYYADAIKECRRVIEDIYNECPEFKKAKDESDKAKKQDEEKKLSKNARIYRYYKVLYLIECLPIHRAEIAAEIAAENATDSVIEDVNWDREDVRMIIGSTALLLQWLTAKIEG